MEISIDASATAATLWPRYSIARLTEPGPACESHIQALREHKHMLIGARLMAEPGSDDFAWFTYLIDSLDALIAYHNRSTERIAS